jgi:YD repeat-containing protein
MKYPICFFAVLFFSCDKDEAETGTGTRLQTVLIDGKIWERYEYSSDNLLLKENRFLFCEQNRSDEFIYVYKSKRLDTIISVMRSFFSKSNALCDPAAGSRSYVTAEYDTQKRLSKSLNLNGTIRTYSYDAQNFIVKQTISFPATDDLIINYKRDAAGNIIEETTSRGEKKRYEYDGNPNPYYLIKQQPDIVTAFNNSPNNRVKIIGDGDIRAIRYAYNKGGLPVKKYERGVTEFVYQ